MSWFLLSVFPREEQQCKCVPHNSVPSGNSLSIPYVSTAPELPFLLCLLFVLHLIQGKAASLSQVLEDLLGWEIPQMWQEFSIYSKHFFSLRFHGILGSLGSEWSGMPLEEILHLLAEIWLEFLFYFLFYRAVNWSCVSPQAENKKDYDIKIWCSGQSCQELKHYFQLLSANNLHPFFQEQSHSKCLTRGFQIIGSLGYREQKLLLKITFLGELCSSVNQNGLFSSHLYQ